MRNPRLKNVSRVDVEMRNGFSYQFLYLRVTAAPSYEYLVISQGRR